MVANDVVEGGIYETSAAIWTVESVSPAGVLWVRRDDGRRTQFGRREFASWCRRRVDAAMNVVG